MDDTFALYVHWPFCRSKCPYCDFNSHVADVIPHARWRSAYVRELKAIAPVLSGRKLTSIFFGGGTPSLMEPDTVAAVIETARALWPASWPTGRDGEAPEITLPEITLEANPTSVEASKFAAFRDAGVNRASVGVQALDGAALKFLGREHSAAEALAALAIAKRTFPRVNADMIYARPGQTAAAWEAELDRLMAEGLGHVSLYQLTIERGTPFFGLYRKGAFQLPDEDAAARLYEATAAKLATHGLYPYEISNYAKPGEECRHNLVYWRYRDYSGIGPGAHGRVAGSAARNLRRPADWLTAVEDGGRGLAEETPLDARTRIAEMVMMGLRLEGGIATADVRRVGGMDVAEAFDPIRLKRLVAGGFLTHDRDRIAATAEGRLRLDAVLAELLS